MFSVQEWLESLEPLSDNELDLISRPNFVVYVTASGESKEAVDFLETVNAWYRIEPAGSKPLSAIWLDMDWSVEGLEGIKRVAKIYGDVHSVPVDAALIPDGGLGTAERTAKMRQRIAERRTEQRQKADALLAQVLHPGA